MSDFVKEWMVERRESRFPNTVTMAFFSPQSQMITLDQYSRTDLPKALLANDHNKTAEILATMSHELTHWADVVGTVWGRDYMKRVYRAFRLLPTAYKPPLEVDFPWFVDLYDETRRLTFPRYYQTLEEPKEPHGAARPWQIAFSAGQEIDPSGRLDPSRPILFVLFLDHETGARLIRQPLTVGALLETTAVASEYSVVRTYLEAKVPENQRAAMADHITKDALARLYAPTLTLYSAPVHLFAHYAKIKDAALAYRLAAIIAHLCLNLGDDHFKGVQLPASMEPWANLFPSFKQRGDRAFVFAVVSANLEPWQDGMDETKWIDAALVRTGLPDRRSIIELALEAMAMQQPGGQGAPLDEAERYMLELGLGVAKGRSNNPSFSPMDAQSYSGVVPPMFDSEGEIYLFPNDKFDLTRFAPKAMIDLDWALDRYTRNLLSGCR